MRNLDEDLRRNQAKNLGCPPLKCGIKSIPTGKIGDTQIPIMGVMHKKENKTRKNETWRDLAKGKLKFRVLCCIPEAVQRGMGRVACLRQFLAVPPPLSDSSAAGPPWLELEWGAWVRGGHGGFQTINEGRQKDRLLGETLKEMSRGISRCSPAFSQWPNYLKTK